jgi:hypothetical protein
VDCPGISGNRKLRICRLSPGYLKERNLLPMPSFRLIVGM